MNPPPDPGATLWSIAVAGPLIKTSLVPILWALLVSLSRSAGPTTDAHSRFLSAVWRINLGLLLFNMLPIYPLDGGQILRCAFLWFVVGRARSLMAATVIGFIGASPDFLLLPYGSQASWFAIHLGFPADELLERAGKHALASVAHGEATAPREFACPSCKTGPLIGPYWICSLCRQSV